MIIMLIYLPPMLVNIAVNWLIGHKRCVNNVTLVRPKGIEGLNLLIIWLVEHIFLSLSL